MKRIFLAIIVFLILAAVAVAGNLGGARNTVLAIIGDDWRIQIVALTSRLSSRPVETADLVPIKHTGMNPVGVNTFLEQEVEVSKRRQSLQMIKDAGIGWIRQQFPWEDIERPAKGQFWDEKFGQSTWDKYDNIVDLANEYGLQIIARLDVPPRWAHPSNEWPATPPDNLDDYGDFVYNFVSRYKGKIHYYQLWNEPNLTTEWGHKPVDPAAYVKLLKVGYQRAKQADPDCVVISAALAPTIEESWQALSDVKYLEQMYAAGLKGNFDIMSVMAYGLRSGPDDRRIDYGDVNFSRPILTREIMVKNGDQDKPIWASEMGWNVQPQSVTAPAVFGRVSEELQAKYTVRAFQRAAEEWPWMGVMSIWFFKRADSSEVNEPFYYFRMVNPDFTTLPVYSAIKEMATKPPVLERGFSPVDSLAISYKGDWKPADAQASPTGQRLVTRGAGATVSFRFKGNDLILLAPHGSDLGSAHVIIDGKAVMANMLLRDNTGKAVLNLSSVAPSDQEQIPVATGLFNDLHRVEIQTAGPFAIDGFIVDTHEPSLAWWMSGVAMMIIPPAVAGAALLVAARRRRRRQPRLGQA